ncbi:MAG TPA: FAD-dependent oxidoreductase [Syntrophomonas sp.]|nr:FAD-dependent oxidoreductase [Syntrophomonas sp.]
MTVSDAVDFDVIVIGAGVAGCVTAYRLAAAGHSVLLVERGGEPGAKNLSGGVFYCQVMEEVFPGFAEAAPVERRITRNRVNFLTTGGTVGVDYFDQRLAEPVNAVSVLRAKLDPWLAQQAVDAGVMLMPGFKVDALLKEEGRIVGIKADEDELRAHVVAAADGINSFISRDAGLRTKEPDKHLALGVKSVIGLPRETIEDRWGLTGDEGIAYSFVGECTQGIGGGGFLYTNLQSVSIGVVLRLDDLMHSDLSPSDVHDRFLNHPAVSPLLRGGELLEYGCHLAAEGGNAMVHDLVHDGLVIVGDAAGFSLNTGFTIRGMDLAAGSGIAAAAAIDAALQAGDCTKAALNRYNSELKKSFCGQDMLTYAKAPGFFENPRLYQNYGDILANIMYGMYNLDTTPRRHLFQTVRSALRESPVGWGRVILDAIAGVKAL